MGSLGGPVLPPSPSFSLICCSGPEGAGSVGEGAWVCGLPVQEASPLARVLGEACPLPHLPHSFPVFVSHVSPAGAIRRATAPSAGNIGEAPAARRCGVGGNFPAVCLLGLRRILGQQRGYNK